MAMRVGIAKNGVKRGRSILSYQKLFYCLHKGAILDLGLTKYLTRLGEGEGKHLHYSMIKTETEGEGVNWAEIV